MKRRNFIKTSLAFSSVVLVSPSVGWLSGEKIKFGYYYPSPTTPETLKKFVEMFQKAGVQAEIENLAQRNPEDVILDIQQGQYAGVFMSTNLMAEKIPALYLLSDAADAPPAAELRDWADSKKELWDKVTYEHNLKRVPFLSIGSRRGLWLTETPDGKLQNMTQAKVYAEGLWARAFEKYGASVTNKDLYLADVAVLSNLYAAHQTSIAKSNKIFIFDRAEFGQTASAGFDLYLNLKYWNSLTLQAQKDIEKYVSFAGQGVHQMLREYDEKALPVYEAKRSVTDLPTILQDVLSSDKMREVRNEAVSAQAAVNPTVQALLDDFNKRFTLSAST